MRLNRDFHQIAAILSLFYLINIIHVAIASEAEISNSRITLYNPSVDKYIELLYKETFEKTLQNSNRCSIVEFFAHWCGSCQRAAPHWKTLSNETRLWQNVIRVAALDCALPEHKDICQRVDVKWYPTFKLFSAMSSDNTGSLLKVEDYTDTETFMKKIIDFIESHSESTRPKHWPELKPFASRDISTLFKANPKMKYAVLIFENDESYDGRKIILDFSSFGDKLNIMRVTPNSNPNFLKKFLSNGSVKKPIAFLITNKPSAEDILFESLDKVVNEQISQSPKVINQIEDDPFFNLRSSEPRYEIGELIRKFIRYNSLLTGSNDADSLLINEVTVKITSSTLKPVDVSNFITSDDLESGINYMLRFEVPKFDVLTGEQLNALKTWLGVLSKYFPGREQVRNYLKYVYESIKPLKGNLPISNWNEIVSYKSANANLPNRIKWRHCKGSIEKYRGYPCSLWVLFHTLTVSRANVEQHQTLIQKENYDPAEVIRGIRAYITNFFGCIECGKNFDKETANLDSEVQSGNFDEVVYLWTVHNRVNKRLSGDVTEDPLHPKIQFPGVAQCPQCQMQKDGKLEFSKDVTKKFLMQFYSPSNIIGLDLGKEHVIKVPSVSENLVQKPEDEKPGQQIESPGKMSEELHDTINETNNKEDNPVVDYNVDEKNRSNYKINVIDKSLDKYLNCILLFVVVSSLGCLFFYYRMLRRKSNKIKRHVV